MPGTPSRGKIVAAFAAVYIIWGSTYLAILYAIETLPPLLMAGARFLIAGLLLYAWSIGRAEHRPRAIQWRAAAVVGALMLLGGNGAVTWSEQHVPSSVAALLVTTTPCWMVLLDWIWNGARRPGARTVIGLALGFGGIVLLIGPKAIIGAGNVHPIGALVLLIGSLCWATGSIYTKRAPVPKSALLWTGMQMLAGGSLLVLAGMATGELSRLDLGAVSLRSALALAYLIVFGAIMGYSAYVWLLRVVRPARVATYAYVNPVVAVLLGWAVAGEALTLRMGVAAIIIIAGVALITLDQQKGPGAERAAPTEPRQAA